MHRRGIIEMMLLLSGILLPCFVMLSVMLSVIFSIVAYCSSYSFFSFWVSCGVDEVGGVIGGGVNAGAVWFDGAKYCCTTERTILTKSWTCYSEKLGTNGSALGILKADRWSIERIDLIIIIIANWIDYLIDGLRSESVRG